MARALAIFCTEVLGFKVGFGPRLRIWRPKAPTEVRCRTDSRPADLLLAGVAPWPTYGFEVLYRYLGSGALAFRALGLSA